MRQRDLRERRLILGLMRYDDKSARAWLRINATIDACNDAIDHLSDLAIVSAAHPDEDCR